MMLFAEFAEFQVSTKLDERDCRYLVFSENIKNNHRRDSHLNDLSLLFDDSFSI